LTRGARGSSVLRPAADTMILLEETDRGSGCLVVCDKQKDFEEFETYKLNKKKVDVGDETSLVFVGSDQWSTRYQLLTKTHKELLQTVKATFDTDPFGWTEAYKASDLKSKDTFSKAIKELMLRSFLLSDEGQYRLNPDAVGVMLVSLAV
jgi:hypothetical protein